MSFCPSPLAPRRIIGILAAVAFFLLSPLAGAENRGQAEITLQGYYLGGSVQHLSDISGVAVQFRNFFPGLGLLSGSFQGYGGEGRFRSGDDYLQLRGLTWGGQRWTFTGGDFRFSSSMVDFPFYNVFNPELSARGIKVEASRAGRQYSFFWGSETLLAGPRVPFRIGAPQMLLGASVQQQRGRLQWGARFLHLSSSPASIEENPFFFPAHRDFRSVNSLAAQALYSVTTRLHLYGEATLSATERIEGPAKSAGGPLSFFFGPAWETPKLSVRANYAYQQSSYLPVLGYFSGDRRGPFGEVRYRPFARLEVFASASRSGNNLERDPDLPTFRGTGYSAGASLKLPGRFTANTQLSWFGLSSKIPEVEGLRDSDNRQVAFSLGRPIRRHNLRVSVRDLKLVSLERVERQRSAEVEDVFQVKRFFLGAAVREQRLVSDQRKNTLFFRGSVQGRLGRLTAYAQVESGSDLINRTVFATSTYNSTVFGVTARLARQWILQAEAFRNSLTTDLNPESIFALENRGLGLSTALAGFNQWSFFFRLTKQLHWGGPLPAEGLDRYAAEQMPLVGAVEGFVHAQTLAGPQPAQGIPVSLDGGRTETTDQNGHFRFSEVPEGAHKVALAAQQLPADYDPGAATQALVAVQPRHTARAELDVFRLSYIQGKVTAPAEVSLESILIRLLPQGRYTTPDADGRFSFYNLREGDYEVVLDEQTLPEYAVLGAPARLAISVRLGSEPPAVEFSFTVRKPEKPVRRILEQELKIEQR